MKIEALKPQTQMNLSVETQDDLEVTKKGLSTFFLVTKGIILLLLLIIIY